MSQPHYHSLNNGTSSPYRSGDPHYADSTGYLAHPGGKKAGVSKWIKIGIPVAVIIIAGAVVGAIFGVRASKNNKASASGNGSPESAASSAASAKQLGVFATATNTYFNPVYPSSTSNAAFSQPTFIPANVAAVSWGEDPFKPSNPSPTTVRTDRPRLIAPQYKWDALPNLIQTDPYLKAWNTSLMNNATQYAALPPVVYRVDGASGVLDIAREVKQRLKAFSYAYRVTGQRKWVDRCWDELNHASGNSGDFGPPDDRWNEKHFLDVAEFTSGFAIAYDWLHDAWTDQQRTQLRGTMIQFGLQKGLDALNGGPNGWWTTDVNGNWNCVCNGGLTLGALAIMGDDTSGISQQILSKTIGNANQNCVNGPSTDGTWAETPHYWYFGTTGHAEMASALMTATGSDMGLLNTNKNFQKTGLFHMAVTGMTSMFEWGDHGPNKFSTTANSMLFYGSEYNQPVYTLYQRDRFDAFSDPFAIFWYDPTVSGAFWDGMALDQYFDDPVDQWAAMRTSWTNTDGAYFAIKAGKMQGHQTHNDLDAGDFVLDAMGQRWAGELGSADYLSPGYFSSDAQDSQRWLYYRKRTEGQNTIIVNKQNQVVTAAPPSPKHETTGEAQSADTGFTVPQSSTAYWTADLTSAYQGVTSFKRGMRFINGRRQILLQDDITATGDIMWRMHTNATITPSGSTATLALGGKTMQVQILNAGSATFAQSPAVRLDGDPTPPAQDQQNVGVSVLTISLPAGTYSLQVLFNPQWDGMAASDFKSPSVVPIDSWNLRSHD